MSDDTPQTKVRPRFSLQSLVLVLVIAACAAGMVRQRKLHTAELAELQRERQAVEGKVLTLEFMNNHYRRRLGMLEVADPSKVYATRLETDADYAWRWQVWIPEGELWRIRVATDGIPEKEFACRSGVEYSSGFGPGEHVFKFVVGVDPPSGRSFTRLHIDSHSIGGGRADWLKSSRGRSYSTGVSSETTEVERGPFELMRLRFPEEGAGHESAPGFLVWIEPSEEGDE